MNPCCVTLCAIENSREFYRVALKVSREQASLLQGEMNSSKREGNPTSDNVAAIYTEIPSLPSVGWVDRAPLASGNR